MAKPLGAKSRLIREAIKAHPNKANKELAELINASPARKDDKIEVTGNDVAQQKQALSKLAEAAPTPAPASPEPAVATQEATSPPAKKRGRPAGKPKKKASAPTKAPAASSNGTSPVALIDGVLSLAKQAGGLGELKHLVERIAEIQGK